MLKALQGSTCFHYIRIASGPQVSHSIVAGTLFPLVMDSIHVASQVQLHQPLHPRPDRLLLPLHHCPVLCRVEPRHDVFAPVRWQAERGQVLRHLLFHLCGLDHLLIALARVLDARLVLVVAHVVNRLGAHGAIAVRAVEDARQEVEVGHVVLGPAGVVAHQRAHFLAAVKGLLVHERRVLSRIVGHRLPLAPAVLGRAVVGHLAGVVDILQHVADRVLAEAARLAAASTPLGLECNPVFIPVLVEHSSDLSIRILAGGVPLERQLHRRLLDGMRHPRVTRAGRAQAGLPELRTVALAVGVRADRAVTPAVAQGRKAVGQALAGASFFALAGLEAQFVEIDLGQRAQHRQCQLAPGRGKVQVLADGDKGHAQVLQVPEGRQQALQIAVEAVDGVDHHDVELALGGVPEQALQRRPVLQGARQARIDVDLHQRPAPRPAELDDGVLLGVQRVALFDLLGRGRPSISNCSHDTPPPFRIEEV
ncbi:MAG TPA: hypothetical protein PKO09_01465 [Anaerolineae bacterium]|nr:hypothetical protein [Anaerolineae bacterium]